MKTRDGSGSLSRPSLAWATLAERAREHGNTIESHAFRPGGLPPRPRRSATQRVEGSRSGPLVARTEPGFLMCLHELSLASQAIGETDEAERTRTFLRDSSAEAADVLGV